MDGTGLAKPAALFDREAEWSELASVVANDGPGASLTIMYGRRRQGKTLMLQLLAEATEGFFFTGLEQSSAQNLKAVGQAYAAFAGVRVPVAFANWEQVVDALLALSERGRSLPVIIDELPYLVRAAGELPSVIQRALSPRGRARQRSRVRLILCGSALMVMSRLLSGTAALRGRAARELVVHPFGFREAASFWGVTHEPELAVRLHALVGGTPAYRDFCEGDQPHASRDLDAWVVRNLLNPSRAFFREGRVLLAEEPEMSELSLYFSILTAIASGATRRGQIAAATGRKENALAHAVTVLEETRLISRTQDVLRANRSTYHVSEPMLRFHQLVIVPNEQRLARRVGGRVWSEVADTVSCHIYGPHFEELAREWTAMFAAPETLGGVASYVSKSELGCAQHHCQHEVDVVAVERTAGEGQRALALGEAKWHSTPVGMDVLERLRHLRTLLPSRLEGAAAKLLVFSGAGFTADVASEASRSRDIELVDLRRLYTGD